MNAPSTADLLIELGCEDLPARYVRPLAEALAAGLVAGLDKRQLAHGSERPLCPATPRRIACLVKDLVARQPDFPVIDLGPRLEQAFRDGKPTPAALGFAKKCGVDPARLKSENGRLVFRRLQKGQRTLALLPEIFEEALKGMDELVPKRMRWGDGEDTFVRPVRWIVALYGSRVVPWSRFGLKAGRKTYGHRFHAPGAIVLQTPDQYEAKLRDARVRVDFSRRREEIRKQVQAEAEKLGGVARMTDALLEEVTALVEWPVVISGRIEERFLELPPEVVIATIEHNQRYFPVFADAEQTRLLPRFITVANIESKEVAEVIAGNERVVRPRLSDALFFWEQDRRQPLSEYVPALDRITFQKDLGSIGDKARRVAALAARIAEAARADGATVARAAALCKADLVTRMVYEFPELQGVMGGYYARASGEPQAVASAIAEHYRPTQSGGPIPSTLEGRVLALADKLDTLAGIFAIGQKPTATKDPFALRRAALGALRICIEGQLGLDLRACLEQALAMQPAGRRDAAVASELWTFVEERLAGLVQEQFVDRLNERLRKGEFAGPAPVLRALPVLEMVQAVRATGATRPLDFMRRAEALADFLARPEAAALTAADKRARNILKQAGGANGDYDARRLERPAERALAQALDQIETDLKPLRAQGDYAAMLKRLAGLKAPVDDFFAAVMVMAEDPAVRANRLALLARLDALCREVADLSCLPG
ncbi:MAG: glycine--tRNA ligase subunit beta [Nevskia sp.]|nr:glycine--tRNA ligase subunit beta [Nevskia sp.]